jgi:hypothetical protein
LKSRTTEEFFFLFGKLPPNVRESARKSYRLWRDNPAHPSLHFKRIHSQEPLYSVRIGRGWRALGLMEDDTVTWFWIGSHAEYDRLIR